MKVLVKKKLLSKYVREKNWDIDAKEGKSFLHISLLPSNRDFCVIIVAFYINKKNRLVITEKIMG